MYLATVVQLPAPRKHNNADALQIFTVLGYQVITDLKAKEGDIGIFLPPDGQVSEEFAKANDLIERVDEHGKRAGGFMSHKRRVRAINLRGEKSQGLWLPITCLDFLGTGEHLLTHLKVGDSLDTVTGHKFCNKYYTPATQKARKQRIHSRKETSTFKRHIETKKFQRVFRYINIDSNIIFTEKVHGTSGRYGRALETNTLAWYNPKRWIIGDELKEWVELSGTRNVIHRSNKEIRNSYYMDNSFRMRVVKPLMGNLYKGETFYFEIVGYQAEDKLIMPSVSTKVLKDKTIKSTYGDKISYTYGTLNGQCKMLVYRITMTNEDGISYDLTWDQVKERCDLLGVEPVHEFGRGYIDGSLCLKLGIDRVEYTRDKSEYLKRVAEKLSVGPSVYDPTHIREGVILRVDSGNPTPSFYKLKSHEFLVLEGHTKNREDYVDPEEAS